MINGLQETGDEIVLSKAVDFLRKVDPTLTVNDIDICYRVGNVGDQSNTNKSTRSLIVIFKTLFKKRGIMDLKKNLKGSQEHQSVYVNEDLPLEVCQARENLREISRYAIEHGHTSKVSGSKLTVDGITYHPHELNSLPKDIKPEKVKTRRRGNGIALQGETSVLSNFYPCAIIYKGMNKPSNIRRQLPANERILLMKLCNCPFPKT